MTLISCPTCNGQVSKNAQACPHCGERSFPEVKPPLTEKQENRRILGWASALGAVVVLMLFVGNMSSDPCEEPATINGVFVKELYKVCQARQ